MTPIYQPQDIVIIGYGNPNRNDDRVGWYVVETLQQQLGDTAVRLETCHQLEVELAEELTRYKMAVFVDCHMSLAEDWRRVVEVTPGGDVGAISHHFDPAALLGMCQTLYGVTLEGWLYTIKGVDFNFGETLSPKTQEAADLTVNDILSLIKTRVRS